MDLCSENYTKIYFILKFYVNLILITSYIRSDNFNKHKKLKSKIVVNVNNYEWELFCVRRDT